jgi:hypothetical protein
VGQLGSGTARPWDSEAGGQRESVLNRHSKTMGKLGIVKHIDNLYGMVYVHTLHIHLCKTQMGT